MEEGCLSVVDFRNEVKRAAKITIKYFDIEGKEQKLIAEDLLAVCIQHEYDHLEGVLFVDLLSPLRKKMLKGKLNDISKCKVDVDYKIKLLKN